MLKKVKSLYDNLMFAFSITCKGSKKYIIYKVLLCILGSLLNILNILLLKVIIDSISLFDFVLLLKNLLLFSFITLALNLSINYIYNKKIEVEKQRLSAYIDMYIFEVIKDKNVSEYNDYQFYNDFSFVLKHSKNSIIALIDETVDCFSDVLSVFAIGGIVISYNLIFIIPMMINICITLFFDFLISSYIHNKNKELVESNRFIEFINRMFYQKNFAEDLKILPIFDFFRNIYDKTIEKNISIIKNYFKSLNGIANLQSFSSLLFQAITIVIVSFKTINKEIMLSDFLVIFNSINQLNNLILQVVDSIPSIYSNCLYINDLSVFKAEKEIILIKTYEEIETIEFEKVDFYYKKEKIIFKSIDLYITKGKLNFILGKNGAGKSTLIKIISGLYEPESGVVKINGIEATSLILQQHCTVLSQDFQLYPVSILQNIILNSEVSDYNIKKINELLKICGLYKKIETLQQGLDTVVTKEFSKNGESFSKGELQKIAILRTLMQDRNIIILDEPFSFLDKTSTVILLDYLHSLSKEKIIIIITHDVSNCNDDNVFYVENAHIQSNFF